MSQSGKLPHRKRCSEIEINKIYGALNTIIQMQHLDYF